jgi:dTDP-4-dehydrorhamnose reductase
MLAEATTQVLAKAGSDLPSFGARYKGIYHLAGAGAASRFEWTKLLLDLAGKNDMKYHAELIPASSDEFPTKAVRPPNSALEIQRFTDAFGVRFPSWQEALTLAISGL